MQLLRPATSAVFLTAFLVLTTPFPVLAQAPVRARAIAAGGEHSLALTSDGSVWEWGAKWADYWGLDLPLGDVAGYAAPTRVSGLDRIVAIAEAYSHSLAIRDDRTVWAWGSQDGGQFGDYTGTNRGTPVQVLGLSQVVAVSGGVISNLALRSDGTVWTWGTLGNGWNKDPGDPPTGALTKVTGLTGVVAIASGYGHSLAMKVDGTVWAWGRNTSGELGDGSASQGSLTAVQVRGLSGVVAIAAGSVHSLALKTDGTVWEWGSNQRTPVQVSGLSEVVSIAAGGIDMALKPDGTLWAWRFDWANAEWSTPAQVTGLSDVASIAVGYGHALALKGDGTIWAWGNNNSRQLGHGGVPQGFLPGPVNGLAGAVAAAAGDAHSMALKEGGTVWTWGANRAGQLGDGTTTDRWAPAPVSGLVDITQIVGGEQHSLALRSDGTVWAWGSNSLGQLGDGTTTDRSSPVQVSGLTGVIAIAASGSQSLALTHDGSVWQWGFNVISPWANGGDWEYWSIPVQVSGLTDMKRIAAGGWRGLASKADGTIWTWGVGPDGDWFRQGQPPAQLTGFNGIAAIAASSAYSVALKDDGTIWMCDPAGWMIAPDWHWLALMTLDQWSGFNEVVAAAVGGLAISFHVEGHTLALKRDGTVWAAGKNWSGELGDGTGAYTARSTPLQVAGLSGVVSISAGAVHSLAVKRDGTVWAWGGNYHGELGVEPSVYRATPSPVIPPGSPDLAIRMSHDRDFSTSDAGLYTLTVTNIGDTAMPGAVTVTDVLPPGLTYRAGAGTGWTCSASEQVVACANSGPIEAGAASAITLMVDVGPAAFPGVTNVATVKNVSDRNSSNDTIGDPTIVLPGRN
jgi:uncharacterized repeat protein (TIGR01451 family)